MYNLHYIVITFFFFTIFLIFYYYVKDDIHALYIFSLHWIKASFQEFLHKMNVSYMITRSIFYISASFSIISFRKFFYDSFDIQSNLKFIIIIIITKCIFSCFNLLHEIIEQFLSNNKEKISLYNRLTQKVKNSLKHENIISAVFNVIFCVYFRDFIISRWDDFDYNNYYHLFIIMFIMIITTTINKQVIKFIILLVKILL